MMRIVLFGVVLVVLMLMLKSLFKGFIAEMKRAGVGGREREKGPGRGPEGLERSIEVLGLRPGASKKEVNEAYRDLVNVWHPDRFANNLRLQKKAEERLKAINAAYEHIRSFYRWK